MTATAHQQRQKNVLGFHLLTAGALRLLVGKLKNPLRPVSEVLEIHKRSWRTNHSLP